MSNLKQSKEELDAVLLWRGRHAVAIKERDALQQRLTEADHREDDRASLEHRHRAEFEACQAAERRVEVLEDLLRDIRDAPGGSSFKKHINAALNPTAEGCVHEFIPFTEGCSKCGEPYTAEGASHE